MMKLLTKIIGDPNERKVKRLQPIIQRINGFEDELIKLSDEDLRGKTAEFKNRVANALRGRNPEDQKQIEREVLVPTMGGAMVPAADDSADERTEEVIEVTGDGASFPPSASMCHKCSTKALVLMDGCATCLNCGYSKCG